MASSSKRTRLTEREQQTLLEDFLNNLDNPDAPGNIDPNEDVDNILDNEQDENIQEIIADATENANENEDTEGEEPRKQKFKNLSEVLDEANYDPLPPQPKRTYKYQTTEMEKKELSTKWTTHESMDNSEIEDDEEEDVVVPVVRRRQPPGKRRASNIVQEEPGPCAEALMRAERWKVDKYTCFCVVFEYLNDRNAKMRIPSLHVTVDETLYPYRGAIGLRIYNPNKPARYGLLIISLSDGEVPYIYESSIFGKTRKP